ncbi:MAG: hypothetical protein ACHQHM_06775, partial [Thermoanaerobaculales bacterium]
LGLRTGTRKRYGVPTAIGTENTRHRCVSISASAPGGGGNGGARPQLPAVLLPPELAREV